MLRETAWAKNSVTALTSDQGRVHGGGRDTAEVREGVRRREPIAGAEINTISVRASNIKGGRTIIVQSPTQLRSLLATYHSFHLCFTVPMAPRTRKSQTKGSVVNTAGTENEPPIPLETSTLANVNTSTRSRVTARRVIPGNPNQSQHAGRYSLNCREN